MQMMSHTLCSSLAQSTACDTMQVHCIRDVQVCIDSGYGLMAQVGTAANPDYQVCCLHSIKHALTT